MSILLFPDWLKFNEYKLKEHEKGLYIIPTKNAKEILYSPFDYEDAILFDILFLGYNAIKNTASPEDCLTFVNQYGFLGFAQSIIEKEYENGTSKLYANNHITIAKAIDYKEYLDLFQPFDKHPHKKPADAEPMPISMSLQYNEQTPRYILEWPDYAEQVDWILNYAQFLYLHLKSVYHDCAGDYLLGTVKPLISCSDKPMLSWEYDSLKSAVDIFYVRLLTATNPVIKLCKHCEGLFIPQNSRTEYCSVSCRNVSNVTKSRKRKRP